MCQCGERERKRGECRCDERESVRDERECVSVTNERESHCDEGAGEREREREREMASI